MSAVKLDWISTHDAFYFCTSRVHAFSCIARSYSFFPIPKCFYCVFVYSLSLSFSLLVMAPKKSIPSKNPIRRGSSSSSFPPNSIWFHDEKAQANFLKNFSDRAIHSEC